MTRDKTGIAGTALVFVLAFGWIALSFPAPALAERKVVFSKLTDPAEFALAKELLSPKIGPDNYDPKKNPDWPGYPWPSTLNGYLRAFVRVARDDINDDGADELFYRFEDPGYCGSAGCWSLIFERRGAEWKSICGTGLSESFVITDWVSEGGYRELQDRYVIYWRNGRCHDDAPRSPETEDLPKRGERTWKPIR